MAVTCGEEKTGVILSWTTPIFQKACWEIIRYWWFWGFISFFTSTGPITNWRISECWLSSPNVVSTVLILGMNSIACDLLKPSLYTVSCRISPDRWQQQIVAILNSAGHDEFWDWNLYHPHVRKLVVTFEEILLGKKYKSDICVQIQVILNLAAILDFYTYIRLSRLLSIILTNNLAIAMLTL